jgi:hypothetical protein
VNISRDENDREVIQAEINSMRADQEDLRWRLDVNANNKWDYPWQDQPTFQILISQLQSINPSRHVEVSNNNSDIVYRMRLELRDQWGAADTMIYDFILPILEEVQADPINPNPESVSPDNSDIIIVGNSMSDSNGKESGSQCMSVAHIREHKAHNFSLLMVFICILGLISLFSRTQVTKE